MRVPVSFSALYAALMLAASPLMSPAQAADIPSHCAIPTVAAIKVMAQSAPDLRIFEFRGEDAKAGIRIFNALPPVGHQAGDRFYIAINPGLPLSRLLIGQSGCVRSVSLVDVRLAIAIKMTIETTAANQSI
jgi:hypothetical protein